MIDLAPDRLAAMPSASGPPDLPQRSASADRTKDRLLDTAAALFRRRGYANATTRELANELGIRKATLYHHINTKEELLEAVCLESLRRLIADVHTILETEADPLRPLIAMHLSTALHDRNLHATMLLDSGALGPERREHVIEQRSEYERLLREVIAADQRIGRLRNDMDARLLTLALLNLLNWTVFWFNPEREWSPEHIANQFTELYLHGAGAPAA
jgi:TetR/AcrR family transcriptional regulator, cholesterol catabolism regulator